MRLVSEGDEARWRILQEYVAGFRELIGKLRKKLHSRSRADIRWAGDPCSLCSKWNITLYREFLPDAQRGAQGASMQGTGVTILVVEDEQLIRDMVADALSDGGFEAEVAVSGEDAVSLLQGNQTKYRALVTDINLFGKLDGWQVGHRARELNPEISVIYMTGAAADQWPAHGVPNSILLTKPFAPAHS